MLRALRAAIGPSQAITARTVVAVNCAVRRANFSSTLPSFSKQRQVSRTSYSMIPLKSNNSELQVDGGKVAMSLLEPHNFLDYEKYERNLKIVRDRYTIINYPLETSYKIIG